MKPIGCLGALMILTVATVAPAAQAPITGVLPAAAKPFEVTPVATFDKPWAMAFLPDGQMLVTEKTGRMLLLSADGKRRTEVAGIPEVNSSGQSALGEVVVHPGFADNRLVYFSYSAVGSPNAITLARGKLTGGLDGARLEEVTTLYSARPAVSGGHYAGRIAFSRDGHLFLAMGERQKSSGAEVIAAGARRVVIVSGILQARDVAAYCREAKARLDE